MSKIVTRDEHNRNETLEKKFIEIGDLISLFKHYLSLGQITKAFSTALKLSDNKEAALFRANIIVSSKNSEYDPLAELKKAYDEKEADFHLAKIFYTKYSESAMKLFGFDRSKFIVFFDEPIRDECLLGRLYNKAILVHPDYDKATKHYYRCKDEGYEKIIAYIDLLHKKSSVSSHFYTKMDKMEYSANTNIEDIYHLSIFYGWETDKGNEILLSIVKQCEKKGECNNNIMGEIYSKYDSMLDLDKSLSYYEKAATKDNDAVSAFRLYEHYKKEPNYDSSITWLNKSYELGYYISSVTLGDHYLENCIKTPTKDNNSASIVNKLLTWFSGSTSNGCQYNMIKSFYKEYLVINKDSLNINIKLAYTYFIESKENTEVTNYLNKSEKGQNILNYIAINTADQVTGVFIDKLMPLIFEDTIACYLLSQINIKFNIGDRYLSSIKDCIDAKYEENQFLRYHKALYLKNEKQYDKAISILEKIYTADWSYHSVEISDPDSMIYQMLSQTDLFNKNKILLEIAKSIGSLYKDTNNNAMGYHWYCEAFSLDNNDIESLYECSAAVYHQHDI